MLVWFTFEKLWVTVDLAFKYMLSGKVVTNKRKERRKCKETKCNGPTWVKSCRSSTTFIPISWEAKWGMKNRGREAARRPSFKTITNSRSWWWTCGHRSPKLSEEENSAALSGTWWWQDLENLDASMDDSNPRRITAISKFCGSHKLEDSYWK